MARHNSATNNRSLDRHGENVPEALTTGSALLGGPGLRADSTSSPQAAKEEPTLFRIMGLVTLSGLVAGTLWVSQNTRAQEQAPGGSANPFAAEQSTSSPQGSRPLRQAEAANPNDPFATPAASSTPPSATSTSPIASDAYRRRVGDYLRQARRVLQEGDKAEALRLATTAELMAARAKLKFQPGELSPTQMIAQIKGEAPPTANLAQAAPTGTTVELAPAMTDAATGDDADRKRQYAQLLVQAAQEHLDKGNLEAARQKALQAQQVDVTYGPFERQPTQILEEIARLQPANAEGPSEAFLAAWNTPTEDKGRQGAAPLPANLINLDALPPKEQAAELLNMARTSLDKGHFDEARSYALAAQKLPVSYTTLEATPQTVLSEIEQKTNTQILAAKPAAAPQATGNPDADRAAAQQLVKQAREALSRGDVAAARSHAESAIQLDATYALFDDRPELVLQDLDNLQSRQMLASAPAEAAAPSTEVAAPAMPQEVAASDNPFAELDGLPAPASTPPTQELKPLKGIKQVAGESTPTLADPQDMQPRHLEATMEQQAVKYERHRTEVLNTVFRAEKLRDEKPEEALELLNQAIADLEHSDLSKEHAGRLMASLKSTRDSIDSYATMRKPLTQLEQNNKEIRDQINLDIETRVRVEHELAKLVDDFNRLMDERRYAEAMTLAKQAREMDPENSAVAMMDWKSKFAYQNDRNGKLKEAKADSFLKQLDDVEWAAVNPVGDKNPIAYDAERWDQLVKGRQPITDARERSPEEIRVQESLGRQVSLNFTDSPLAKVMGEIGANANINVVLDEPGLLEEGVSSNTPITINVDGIRLKSALNLILKPLNLDYTIEDEVLKITSGMRQQGELQPVVYPVADLVVPIRSHAPTSQLMPMGMGGAGFGVPGVPMGQLSIPGTGGTSVGRRGSAPARRCGDGDQSSGRPG